MSRPQEFDVPQLGPAGGGEPRRPAAPARRGDQAPPARGGYLLHSLVLVLLTGATSGLAYWGYGLQQDLRQSQALLAEASGRLAEVEQLLEVTSDSAAQSGQSLRGRLEAQASAAEAKYSHFDSEIAKLWTIAYQRNKPKLETLETQLAEQSARLESLGQAQQAQDKAFAAQSQQLAPLPSRVQEQSRTLAALGERQADIDSRLASLSGLEAGQSEIRSELDQTLDELRRSLAALDTQVRVSEEMQAEQVAALKADQQAALGRLGERLAALEQGAGTADLGRRVRVNEQAIQAIDGSRRQFNQNLLQLRAQLNELQRRMQ
ncbi:hypothetical protein GCM10011348_25670 [Marinobacterium nitratireducens]|uniref:Uncharacterized protein n=1 Tax=Marinobacterium nitratireducens TaxID=518897 RepID=A0A918DTQ9_9GAMM|nr:hypothetical protein [Marinobacterium nitratireducens]GGO82991.1 hypothetical protein GCM10011348_25670 [Marinobacterium nitratireducens]